MRLLIIIMLAISCMATSYQPLSAAPLASAKEKASKPRIISKSQAINAAKRQVNGKVLSASLISSRGPAVYRVKLLVSEKRVRTVFVDGRTGSVIRIN
ncbi:MAG: PepSY domain-containing protein [Gammaproteobacteria bacterium]